VYWLHKNNLYENISLWSYIEVLNQIDSKYLSKIELSWYQNKKPDLIYKNGFLTPITCSQCNNKVVSLLDEFSYNNKNRKDTLKRINSIVCDCKENWKDRLKESSDFKENIKIAYEKMAIDILGNKFWSNYKNILIQEIENDFKNYTL